jgi:hypothetical protein
MPPPSEIPSDVLHQNLSTNPYLVLWEWISTNRAFNTCLIFTIFSSISYRFGLKLYVQSVDSLPIFLWSGYKRGDLGILDACLLYRDELKWNEAKCCSSNEYTHSFISYISWEMANMTPGSSCFFWNWNRGSGYRIFIIACLKLLAIPKFQLQHKQQL